MTEDVFWNTTPRKFNALSEAALEYKENLLGGSSNKKDEPKYGYIDQIPGW